MFRRILRVLAVVPVALLAIYAWPEPDDPRPVWFYLLIWACITLTLVLTVRLKTRSNNRRTRWIIATVILVLGALVWSQPELIEGSVVSLFIIAAAWLFYQQGRRPVFQYLHLTRYPLAMLLLFFLVGPICLWGAPAFLSNLLELRLRSLIVVTAMALIVAKALVLIVDLFVRWGDLRGEQPWKGAALYTGRLVRTALSDLFALPLIVILLVRADTTVWWVPFAAVGAGMAIGHAIIYMALLLSAYLGPPKQEHSGPLARALHVDPIATARNKPVPWAQRLHTAIETSVKARGGELQRGLLTKDGKLLPGYMTVAAFTLGTLIVYGIAYFPLRPGSALGSGSPYEVPALAYLLGLVLLLALVLSTVSFLFDRYRVPAAAVLIAVPLVLFFLNDVDYYYELPSAVAAAAPPTAGQLAIAEKVEESDIRTALRARAARWSGTRQGKPPVVIAVSASGGGITAAYWTAHVLTGLQREFGTDFSDAIHFISAVSGGSVGTMQYANGFGKTALPDPDVVTDAAGQSSLAAVAWGMTYPDFWRTWGAPPFRAVRDRGWALEEAWSRTLPREETLAKWRNETLEGWRPAVAFNATVAETGERLVFSSLRLNTIPPACLLDRGAENDACDNTLDARTVWSWYPNNTLPVVRAARLSAAFPFVSPIARARGPASARVNYHVADGGYYDNFGVVTMIEWLRKVVLRWSVSTEPMQLAPPHLLIIEIRESDYRGGNAREPRRRTGWTYAFTGPLNTMLEVRRSSQATRNDLDLQLFSDWVRSMKGWNVSRAIFTLPADAPMSWHLSDQQKRYVADRWSNCYAVPTSSVGEAYATVARVIGRPIAPPAPAAGCR